MEKRRKKCERRSVPADGRPIFNKLKGTPSASIFAEMAARVIIIRRQKVTPRGAHYEIHKLRGEPSEVILNNEYENGR